jgi:predicted transcriptional regulator
VRIPNGLKLNPSSVRYHSWRNWVQKNMNNLFGRLPMSFRLKATDCNILGCLAEYRILTVSQVAVFFNKGKQAIRRRLRDLEELGLIEVVGTEFGRGRGRPENSLGLQLPNI